MPFTILVEWTKRSKNVTQNNISLLSTTLHDAFWYAKETDKLYIIGIYKSIILLRNSYFSIVIIYNHHQLKLTIFKSMSSLQYTICTCQGYICSTVKLCQFLQFLPKYALYSSSSFTTMKDQQRGVDMERRCTPFRELLLMKDLLPERETI